MKSVLGAEAGGDVDPLTPCSVLPAGPSPGGAMGTLLPRAVCRRQGPVLMG